ncbi:MAG: hypothetical protein RIR49_1208 [Actinomycetota bacterium]|jgi:uncharacterized protein (TIGR03083 family)
MNHPSVQNLRRCWSSIDGLLAGLAEERWATRSLCPDWDIAGVVVHLVAVEEMLLGADPSEFAERLPFDRALAASTEMADLSPDELLDRFRSVTVARGDELDQFGPAAFDTPVMTPVGPGTYGRFMDIRVFDHWVHEQDMRRPLDLPGHIDGPAAERSIDEIEMSLPYIVGKRIGLPDGRSIAIHLSGPVTRSMYLRVDGRAGAVDHVDDPDVTLTSDSTTFALLACGRIDPEQAIDGGLISWSGDDEIGSRAARNLRFTM